MHLGGWVLSAFFQNSLFAFASIVLLHAGGFAFASGSEELTCGADFEILGDVPLPVAAPVHEPKHRIFGSSRAHAKYFHEKYQVPIDDQEMLIPSTMGGADGVIYLGKFNGEDVAIKIPKPRMNIVRFDAEVELNQRAAKNNPGVLPSYPELADALVTPLKPYTLTDKLAELAPKDTASAIKVLDMLEELADTVDRLHEQRIVHRDLKPANIFLNDSDRTFVGDFSYSAMEGGFPAGLRQDVVSGTFSHMPPEYLVPETPARKSADIFALSVIAWELGSGMTVGGAHKTPLVRRYDLFTQPFWRPIRSMATQNRYLPKYLEPFSTLGMLRPRKSKDFRSLATAVRNVIEAQIELENEPDHKRVRELRAEVERAISDFYGSRLYRLEVDRMIQELPESIRQSREIFRRLSPVQKVYLEATLRQDSSVSHAAAGN